MTNTKQLLTALRTIIREWDEPYYGDFEERCDRLFGVIEEARPLLRGEEQ